MSRVWWDLQVGGGAVVRRVVRLVVRRGAAARVPDGGALQEHLFAVAERVAALAAARARGVEVVVVSGLRTTNTTLLHAAYVTYAMYRI